jgi:hypothetical protein
MKIKSLRRCGRRLSILFPPIEILKNIIIMIIVIDKYGKLWYSKVTEEMRHKNPSNQNKNKS